MKYKVDKKVYWPAVGLVAAAFMSGFVATSVAADEKLMIHPDADKILSEMSEYMSQLPRFSADFDTSTDIITADGQKIKLASSGSVVLDRPDHFRIKRLGTLSGMEFILDGEQLTLYGMKMNGYLQVPAANIDEAVTKVRDDIGFEVPGADIMLSNPLDMDATDVVSGTHVGMTTISGVSVHHLAFRGDEVDWQIWVKEGDDPLPMQYVITSKLVAGAPEYSLLISNWNTEPQIDDATFTFVPPSGAQKVSEVTIDVAGNISDESE